jgi:DegV family protein with EDD domain
VNGIIVTDSASDIPREIVQQLGIFIIPVNLHLDGKIYKDGEDLTSEDFFKNIDKYATMHTSPVSYEDYILSLLPLAHKYKEILIVHCSSKISETYHTALEVKKEFEGAHNCKIEVIDSTIGGMALGLVIIAAARQIAKGASIAKAAALVHDMIKDISVFVAVPSLTYLRRNKKIGGLKAILGSAIGVKPVLGFEDGRMVVKTKLFREKKNMILAMLDIIREDIGDHPISLAISHAENTSTARRLKDVFEATFDCRSIITTYFGPALGISTGPGTLGVAYYKHPN